MITIPTGRVPLMNDDGSVVACGNRTVFEVKNGVVTELPGTGVRYPCGFQSGQVVVSRETTTNGLPDGPPARVLEGFTGTPIPIEQNPGWHPTRALAGGHIVSSANGQHFVDGAKQQYGDGRPFADIDDREHTGTFYLHPSTDVVPWAPTVRRIVAPGVARLEYALDVTIWHPDHDWLQNGRVFRSPADEAWIFGNQHGVATLFRGRFAGQIVRIPGEGACAVSWNGPDAWLWTCRIDGSQPVVLARPLSDVLVRDVAAPAIIRRGLAYDSLEVRLSPDGKVWRVASYISGHDGTTHVDEIPVDSPLEVFVPTAPPLPELRLPTLAPMRLGWLGGDNEASGSVAGGDDTTGRPQIEGCQQDGSPWTCDESKLWFEWISPYESKRPDVELANAKARALRTGAAIVNYCDRERYTEERRQECLQLQRDGYGVIPQLCAYPDTPSDTVEAVLERLELDAELLEPDFEVLSIDLPGYTQTNFWPAALVGEINDRVLNDFLPRHPQVKLLTWFGYKRRLEPQLVQTWLHPYINAVMASATDLPRSAFPRSVGTVAPVPVPDAPVPVTPPVPSKPMGHPTGKSSSKGVKVAAGIGGLIAGLLALFGRRKRPDGDR